MPTSKGQGFPYTHLKKRMFFIIPILCNSYFKQLISTCSTVSGIWHWSQNPVGYFPIIYRVLFDLLCPFLNLVITVSSLLFHPSFSTVPTLFIITYKSLCSICSICSIKGISMFYMFYMFYKRNVFLLVLGPTFIAIL